MTRPNTQLHYLYQLKDFIIFKIDFPPFKIALATRLMKINSDSVMELSCFQSFSGAKIPSVRRKAREPSLRHVYDGSIFPQRGMRLLQSRSDHRAAGSSPATQSDEWKMQEI